MKAMNPMASDGDTRLLVLGGGITMPGGIAMPGGIYISAATATTAAASYIYSGELLSYGPAGSLRSRTMAALGG
ncbi:hypothetical protein V6N11_075687 [Hibiscus sabdariffa]|uniref:Uncharacterized protein n=1 Tax=Hibiscus sabdariffa TaxID=183260 RepID=A0ABR2N6S2_9ROSI